MHKLNSFFRTDSGAAAAEMALVTPLLIILMFGAFELGNYFYSQHVVTKAVRDGARFASRSLAINMPCNSAALPPAVVDDIKAVTRTGQVSGGSIRLAGWSSDTTVTVLPMPVSSGSYLANGIYGDRTSDICVIKVNASVAYTSLFQTLGLSNGSSLTLTASSEAPIFGI